MAKYAEAELLTWSGELVRQSVLLDTPMNMVLEILKDRNIRFVLQIVRKNEIMFHVEHHEKIKATYGNTT